MHILLNIFLVFTFLFIPIEGSMAIASEEKITTIDYINQIKERGTLLVGIPPYNTPPFYYFDVKKNDFDGYDINIAKGLAEKLGVEVEFDNTSKNFNDTVFRAGKGDYDLAIGKLSTTYGRMSDAHPHIYMNFRHAILVNRKFLATIPNDKNSPEFVKNLMNSNMKIGFIANSAYENYANNYMPNLKKFGFKNWKETKESLISREIDAIYRDSTEIKKIIYQNPNLSIDYVPIMINDLEDKKSIFLSSEANFGMSEFIEFYLNDIGQKGDAEIMEQFSEYYKN